MADINKMAAGTGRRLKENNTTVNIADLIEALHAALITTGITLPAGAATEAKQDAIVALVGALTAAAVTDPAASASAIAALKGILADLGQNTDAAVAAGAIGSLSAKIRRLTTDLDTLLTKVGEVVVSPAENTILARLKDIKDGVQLTGSTLRQTQISTDQTIIWANSAAINTQQTVTFTKPASPVSEYELIVYNPSTITDITVKIFNVETSLGAGTRDALVTTVSIPKSQAVTGTTINTQAKYLHGVFNGTDCKLVLSNDTVLGVADGFSAYLRIREVG
jgi:hypothetical protein